jgi:putative acetyltransferase
VAGSAETSVHIELVSGSTIEVKQLLTELDRVLSAEYEPEQRHALAIEEVFQPGIHFFLARLDGEAAGCGGVALFGDYGEVKRMYSREWARGRGVGKALLARIESDARAAGSRILRLETGTRQTAAIGLYEQCGFRRRGPFGHYADLPQYRIAASLFYEKHL